MENILYGLVISQLLLLPLAHKWGLDFNRMIAGGLVVGLSTGLLVDVLDFFFVLSLSSRLVSITTLVAVASSATILLGASGDSGRLGPDRKEIIAAQADETIE